MAIQPFLLSQLCESINCLSDREGDKTLDRECSGLGNADDVVELVGVEVVVIVVVVEVIVRLC